ncbi:restriction endonuclease subunit S [Metamycoplasma equirhinis]|uniref:restriction endonuclease subunit S n=1 Tax=Metamycoplasma equirhinis TaxID=92402 RepID=UPI003593987D
MKDYNQLLNTKECELVDLGEIIEVGPKSKSGISDIKEMKSGEIICLTSGSKTFYVDQYLVDGKYIFMNDGGQSDTKYHEGKAYYSDHVFAFTTNTDQINTKYIYHYLVKINELINEKYFRGGGIKNLVKREFLEIKIPIPPLEIQNEIVNILDKFTELTAELTARQKQYEYYRNSLLNFNDIKLGGE